MSRSRSPAPPDLSPAWHAQAPSLPPGSSKPPPRTASRASNSRSRPVSPAPPASRSQSLEFDAATRGGTLPADTFAPEPEQPRSRANSTQRPPVTGAQQQGAYGGGRSRHDSSPASSVARSPHEQYAQQAYQAQQNYAAPAPYAAGPTAHPQQAYHQQPPQQHAQYAQQPPQQQGYYQPQQQQQQVAYASPSHAPQQGMTWPAQQQQQYASQQQHPQQGAYYAQQSAPPASYVAYGQPQQQQHPQHMHAVPQQQQYHQQQPPQQQQQQPATYGYYAQPQPAPYAAGPPAGYAAQPTQQQFPVMGPPAVPASSNRPLPSPSTRTPSLPSAPGSLSSAPSVRRTLPQPPPGAPVIKPSATAPSLPQAALSRTDSMRAAAEALMARGPPRRGATMGTLGRTATQNAAIGRSPDSPTASSSSPTMAQRPELPSVPSAPAARQADPRDALARDLSHRASVSSFGSSNDGRSVQPPFVPPPRPSSRGPRDDIQAGRERRASSGGGGGGGGSTPPQQQYQQPAHSPAPPTARVRPQSLMADASSIPLIRSPPPDRSPPVPPISFDAGMPSSPIRGPAIFVGEPTAPVVAVAPPPPVFQFESVDDAPRIAVSGPDISVSSAGDDEMQQGGMKPSISVSHSGPLASPQRASASPSPELTKAVAAPAVVDAASAPTLGSGFACGTCRKWIGGRVVSAMGQRFHPACFACSHCGEHLEHVAFYEHEGKPFCHFDYHELFSRRCFHCRTPIVDERFITISDPELLGQEGGTERSYHDLHFFCANCGDPFLDPKAAGSVAGANPAQELGVDEAGNIRAGGKEFVVHKGYPYCENCHVKLHKPRCKGCKQPIADGDVISALKAKWHPHCFVCESCRRPFETPNFFIRDGKAYDEDCYKVLLRSEL